MSRVITFSRTFPKYHPRAGEPTFFVEKILKGVDALSFPLTAGFDSKYHTIRAGGRFKINDWFSPRIWSGRPYGSKQIRIAEDFQVKQTWKFEARTDGNYYLNKKIVSIALLKVIAHNDGFEELDDFECWFPKMGFSGQIISWHENIDYGVPAKCTGVYHG